MSTHSDYTSDIICCILTFHVHVTIVFIHQGPVQQVIKLLEIIFDIEVYMYTSKWCLIIILLFRNIQLARGCPFSGKITVSLIILI